MPSINISVYLDDLNYQKYLINKEEINKDVRNYLKKSIKRLRCWKMGDTNAR